MRCRTNNDKEKENSMSNQDQTAIMSMVKTVIEHGETIENIKVFLQHFIDNTRKRKSVSIEDHTFTYKLHVLLFLNFV